MKTRYSKSTIVTIFVVIVLALTISTIFVINAVVNHKFAKHVTNTAVSANILIVTQTKTYQSEDVYSVSYSFAYLQCPVTE